MRSLLARSRDEGGSALVEMAVVMPVLVMLLVGAADLARVFYYAMELTTAARAGAQYGSYNSATVTETANITAAAQNAAPNISPITVILATPPGVCQCALDDGTGQPWAAVACTATCPSGRHIVEYITVQSQKTFTIISRFLPINRNITLTRSATMRVAL